MSEGVRKGGGNRARVENEETAAQREDRDFNSFAPFHFLQFTQQCLTRETHMLCLVRTPSHVHRTV